jgi:outer membrane protein assembly factor BamB
VVRLAWSICRQVDRVPASPIRREFLQTLWESKREEKCMTVTRARPLFVSLGILTLACAARAGNWPQWRGPAGNSVSEEKQVPLRWTEASGIVWKCSLPEWGDSTPAIWADAIFLTSHQDDKLVVLKVSKATGQVEWTREVGKGRANRITMQARAGGKARGDQKFHDLHNLASPSPVTDGERVIVHFGNGDLAAYDSKGERLWLRNLQNDHGPYTIWWGHANSPVLVDDLVICVCMQDSLADLRDEKALSYLVAYDKRTGEQRWKTLRMTAASAEECDSYTTPIVCQVKGRRELVVMGGNQIDAYDPVTGKQQWFLPGIVGGRTITGPTAANGLVYATQGMRGPLLAVRLDGRGKLTPEAVVWKETVGTADSCCPVVWKDLIFWITDNGIVQCHDASTGELKWKERLMGTFKASPVAADGRVYFLNQAGVCTVVAAAPSFKKLAENKVDDQTIASPAIAEGRIYLRGKKSLYCIGAE